MAGINWNDLIDTAKGVQPLAKGSYAAVVTEAEATQSKSGNDMIVFKFKITEGPHKGRSGFRFWNTLIPVKRDGDKNPYGVHMWFRRMAALGLQTAYFANNPSLEQAARDCVGKNVIINIVEEEYNGTTQNKVMDIKPPTSGAIEVTVPGGGSDDDPFAAPAAEAANDDDAVF